MERKFHIISLLGIIFIIICSLNTSAYNQWTPDDLQHVVTYDGRIGLPVLEEDGGIKVALNIDYAGISLRLPVIEKGTEKGLLATSTENGYVITLLSDGEEPDLNGGRDLFIPFKEDVDDIVLLFLNDIKITKNNEEKFAVKNSNCGYHLGWESTILMKTIPRGLDGYVVEILYRDGHYIIPLMQAPKGQIDVNCHYNKCWDVRYNEISVLLNKKL